MALHGRMRSAPWRAYVQCGRTQFCFPLSQDIDLEEKESCCCGACDSGPDQHAGRYYMEPLNSSWSHQLTPPTGRIVAAQCLCRCARAAGRADACIFFSFLRGAATATAAKREGRGRGADRRQTPAHDRFNRTRAHCPT